MAMSFEQPDFDAIKEERELASGKKKKDKTIKNEDDCWQYLYTIKKFETTDTDDGYREIYKNTLTNKFRSKKKIGSIVRNERRSNVKIPTWDWDGEAYELN